MKIDQDQIDSTEPFGMLDGKPVSLLRLKGGLNLATQGDKVLGAASHQAILCYTIEQRFPSFQPMVMKSEGTKLSAESHSHFLTDDLRKSGYDIYSIQVDNYIEFYVTKQNLKLGMAKGSIKDGYLEITQLNVPTETGSAISGAVSEKALSSGAKKVRFQ